MGYTTYFDGELKITPALNSEQVDYLRRFSRSRRMERTKGPYYIGTGDFGQDREDDILNYNNPGNQPSLWCDFYPTEDGEYLVWNGKEKTYCADDWVQYLIDHFFSIDCKVEQNRGRYGWDFSQVPDFTGEYRVEGEFHASGEESGDLWKLEVLHGRTRVRRAHISYY